MAHNYGSTLPVFTPRGQDLVVSRRVPEVVETPQLFIEKRPSSLRGYLVAGTAPTDPRGLALETLH
jgi:hypothetical protein